MRSGREEWRVEWWMVRRAGFKWVIVGWRPFQSAAVWDPVLVALSRGLQRTTNHCSVSGMCIVCLMDSSHTSTHLVWLQSARVRARAYVYYRPCPVLCCCGRHASRVQSQTIPGYYRTKHSAGVARLTASLCGLYTTPLHYVLPLLYHPPSVS